MILRLTIVRLNRWTESIVYCFCGYAIFGFFNVFSCFILFEESIEWSDGCFVVILFFCLSFVVVFLFGIVSTVSFVATFVRSENDVRM